MGGLDMLTENMAVRIRLILYGVLVFFSFFIFVGVAVMRERPGFCLLYFDGFRVPPSANCNYPMAIAIILQLIYTLFRIVILMLLVLGKFTTEMFVFSNILELVYVLIDVAAFILTFIGACILSAGRNSSNYIYRDQEATASNVSQAGAWISTILWLVVAAVGVLYVLRSGKVPSLRGSGAASSGNTGGTTASAPPDNSPANYDTPKY